MSDDSKLRIRDILDPRRVQLHVTGTTKREILTGLVAPIAATHPNIDLGALVTFLIFFTNPKSNPAGQANVRCDLRLTAPTGKISQEQKDVACFSGTLKGNPYNIYLAAPVLAFSGDPGDPPGIWVMDVRLRDAVRNVELALRRTIELK